MASNAARVGLRPERANLQPYAYQELAGSEDIRLAALLPGEGDDPVRVCIHHASLAQVSTPPEVRTILPLEELRETVPDLWKVYETVEGRILFAKWVWGQGVNVSWDHPVPGFDPALYRRDPEPEEPPATAPPSKYEALSYTWGPPGQGELIRIAPGYGETRRHDRGLAVRENLAAALRHLRQPDKPRILWIDQICIDQGNDAERAKQVGYMAKIYASAWRVVVWLGAGEEHEDGSGSDAAIDGLSSLGRQVQTTMDMAVLFPPGGQALENQEIKPIPMSQLVWLSIRRLLDRPWFERMWIVQEMFCANRRAVLQCGTRVASWLLFYRGLLVLLSQRDEILQPPIPKDLLSPQKISKVLDLTWQRLEANNGVLSYILRQAAGRKCSDQRDKVYGLLALLSPAFRSAIRPPSYQISVKDLMVDVNLAHIRHVRRLELLHSCTIKSAMAEGVPSWVPSLATEPNFHQPREFAAGFSECSHVAVGSDLLQVLGVRSCVVARALTTSTRNLAPDIRGKLMGLGKECENPSRTAKGPCFRELIARTVVMNKLPDRFPKLGPGFMGLDELCLTFDSIERTGREPGPEAQDLTDFDTARTFLVTREGLLGLGPEDSCQDDIVVVLLGCNSPMVLRKGTEPGQFLVVGRCYFLDLQDANALLGPLPGEGRWRVEVEEYKGLGVAPLFVDTESGLRTDEDPRLPPLPPPWEAVDDAAGTGRLDRTLDDPQFFRRFRNTETGEVVTSDPRMWPDALRARGVPLEWFTLA